MNLRLTKGEAADLDNAAHRAGVVRSEYVRTALARVIAADNKRAAGKQPQTGAQG